MQYFQCEQCGFIQTEEPFWLEEAYSSAIASQDVGIMQRNLVNASVTSAVIKLLFHDFTEGVDYGAGHGIFVRMMRDRGFKFSWYDRYATNDYARGFEWKSGTKAGLVTAFEVLEHLENPVPDLAALMSVSDNVLVSTLRLPEPAPRLSEWWYFVPTTGQHIAFYTDRSLQILARRFGRTLLSHGPYHLFTKHTKSRYLFGLAAKPRFADVLNLFCRRGSLVENDFEHMTR